jgi:hypothetical protein
MPCQEFFDLKVSYDVANKRRLTAVGDLIELAGRVDQAGFENLKWAVKDTAETCLAAWKAMNEHRRVHCCDFAGRKSQARVGGRRGAAPDDLGIYSDRV